MGSKKYDKSDLALIIRLNASLKTHGQHMEMFQCELLDKAQVALRNACKDTTLDIVARLHLLEIIELRAMKWVLTDSVINYYKQKLSMVDVSTKLNFQIGEDTLKTELMVSKSRKQILKFSFGPKRIGIKK